MDDIPLLQVLRDHNNEVTACDISICNVLATGSSDKTVRVWEWKCGQGFVPVHFSPLPAHKYAVTALKFSPQGTMLLTASVDGTSALWNARTGSKVRTLVQATRCSVRRCDFTPDSSQVITAGDDGVFCFWDLLHGTLLRTSRLHDEEDACVLGLSVSPDSELLLSGDTGGLLRLWRLSRDSATDLECLSFTKNVNDGVACCAFSPKRSLEAGDGLLVRYLVATSGCDGRILLWDVSILRGNKTDSSVKVCDMVVSGVLEGHDSDVHCVRFNTLGTLLCSTGLDKLVNVWQVEDGSCQVSLKGHTRYGNCCAFNKDGTLVVSGSNDRTVMVWDVSGELALLPELAPECSVSSHFSAEMNTETAEALLAQQAEAEDSRLELLQVLQFSAAINSCCFSPTDLLAIAGGEKVVKLYERGSAEFVPESCIDNHAYTINYLDISPCGSRLISCAMDGLLLHFHIQMGLTSELKNSAVTNSLRTCAFSPAGDLIAAGGDDELVFLWDAASLEFIRTAQQHKDAVTGVAFSADGRLLASCCCAGEILLFDLLSGETVVFKDNAHDLGATSCAFAPSNFFPTNDEDAEEDDQILASCGNDSLIKIWRANVSRLSLNSQLIGHGGNVAQIRFSCTVPFILVSAATDNTARIWNVKSGECIYVVEHHESLVNSCCLSRDNSLLATGSLDKTVAIWRVPELLLNDTGSDMYGVQFHKRVQHWSPAEVAQWLIENECPDAAAQAETVNLSGSQLLAMSDQDVLDLLQVDGDKRKELEQLLWWLKQEAAGPVLPLDKDIPHQFLCPITHDVMFDPVLCSDGFTYERAAITEWLVGGRATSPMTNEPLSGATIRPNTTLKHSIYKFRFGDKPDA